MTPPPLRQLPPAAKSPTQRPTESPVPAPISPLLAAARQRRSDGDEDIDITPMIDITFLMLIFFLVGSTPDQKTAIELPEALYGKAVAQLESVVFTIAEGGLDQSPVYEADGKIAEFLLSENPEAQAEQIREAVARGKREGKNDVVIKADRGVTYRNVARVMSHISEIEDVKLHLAVLDTE